MAGALRHDLTIQTRPISELTPWAKNPRDNDAAAEELAYTISEVGWTNPILLDKHGTIIAGHTRLKAALKLGLTEVPTITLDVDGPQAELIAIADNRLSEFAEWDKDALAEILESLQAEGIDTKIAGYGDDDLSELLASLDSEPIGPDDIEPEAPPEEPDSKRGEVYELGPHRLICGDSTDAETVKLSLAGATPSLVVTDPPYGVNYDGGAANEQKRKAIEGDESFEAGVLAINLAGKACGKNAALYCWFAGTKGSMVYQAIEGAGFEVRSLIVWRKLSCGFGAPSAHYLQDHEPCLYAVRGSANFIGPSTERAVWEIKQPTRNEHHPTQKPIACMEKAITNHAPGLVFDPFGGSGTTLIACARTGRTATLIELDPGYCDVIRKRWTAWAKEAGQEPGPGALD
jgi:site-specific DNA-methyltransferase (adenine-specific)